MVRKYIWKSLLVSYLITILLLLILAFLLFQFQLSEKIVGAGISGIYILSCFVGGYFTGRGVHQRKYLWGAAIGMLYFLLMLLVTLVMDREEGFRLTRTIMTLFLCVGGGTIGGMIA